MMSAYKKHRVSISKWLILSVILVLIIAELFYSKYALTVSRYTVHSDKIAEPVRIVFLSDLHGREFGKGNSRLLEKMAAEEPDIIALVGDFFEGDTSAEEADRVFGFINDAAKLAPVYFGLGNHEHRMTKERLSEIVDKVNEAGAIVLEAEFDEVVINGSVLRIGGYSGYYRTPHMDTDDSAIRAQTEKFFNDFEDTESFKLLLNHIPTNWLDWEYRDKYPVDLVLSGHYHGGAIRIPLLEQGLYAPYVGWFPRYTQGCFAGEKAVCILTTGLAGANGVPRFFNPPEIVTVDILPGEAAADAS